MQYGLLKKFVWATIFTLISFAGNAQKKATGWRQLFNGKNLDGWDTWLRGPDMLEYEMTYDSAKYQPVIGLNKDPLKVFTVHDGLLHISGEIWGAVTSKEEFGNYHLRFQTKWGEKKWREKSGKPRDGGLLFHCTGPFDFAFKCWMRSMEMQVQEGEIGDFFNVLAGDAEFQFTPAIKTIYNETADQYDPTKPPLRHPGRVWRSGNFETPGAWNTGELVARQADAVFIVNGFVVNRLYNIFRKDLGEQVTHGKLQFQSEGAEHFYRTIEIRPISFVQSSPKLVAAQDSIVVTAEGRAKIEIANHGEAVEIIAAELIGKNIEQFVVKLPALPRVIKQGEKLVLPVALRNGNTTPDNVTFRLETVLGPVADFKVRLYSK